MVDPVLLLLVERREVVEQRRGLLVVRVRVGMVQLVDVRLVRDELVGRVGKEGETNKD